MKLKIKEIKDTKSGISEKTGKPWMVHRFIGVDDLGHEQVYSSFSKQIKAGIELEGEVTEKEYNGAITYQFDPATEKKGFGRSPEERLEIIRQSSIGYALQWLELRRNMGDEKYVAMVDDVDKLFVLAQKFVDWVKK